MFRSSTRQLARCARLSLRPAVSPAFRAARFPQNAPAAALLKPRFQSTNPQRPDPESEKHSPKTQDEPQTEAPRNPPLPALST
ncbi:hypothetical protein MMYC01_200674 [Madurella mycetomatis]|uniref:Uncharacterized protein n=1 Tax=Madurella mycetomatis TaxID=100816 RepID=A0A175WE24_9PEZI|nr:hypothetical protein MMYC01_200674 [Madurella mycetomatis]